MGTTADKLAYLNGTKTAIKNAIVAKGVAVPDGTTFRAYADKISSIQDVSSLPTQGAKTVTPTTSEQIAVASGIYTTGDVKVAGDANLVPENIAEGVSIFGVVGTLSGSSFTSGVASVTASEYLRVPGDLTSKQWVVYANAFDKFVSSSSGGEDYACAMIYGNGSNYFASGYYTYDGDLWYGIVEGTATYSNGETSIWAPPIGYGFMYFSSNLSYNYVIFG